MFVSAKVKSGRPCYGGRRFHHRNDRNVYQRESAAVEFSTASAVSSIRQPAGGVWITGCVSRMGTTLVSPVAVLYPASVALHGGHHYIISSGKPYVCQVLTGVQRDMDISIAIVVFEAVEGRR